MSQSSPRLSTGALLAIAIGLGAAAGAGWVYWKGPASGNGAAMQNAPAPQTASCPAQNDRLAALKPFARGEVAAMSIRSMATDLPPLAFVDETGAKKSMADFAGRTVLVNLWATWCAPCRAEMPALAELESTLGGDRFQVLAINIDTGTADKPKAFLEEIGVSNLGLYRDETIGVFNTLKKEGYAFGLPVTLLVGADGCLLGAMNGPAEWASEDAKALIRATIGVGEPAT